MSLEDLPTSWRLTDAFARDCSRVESDALSHRCWFRFHVFYSSMILMTRPSSKLLIHRSLLSFALFDSQTTTEMKLLLCVGDFQWMIAKMLEKQTQTQLKLVTINRKQFQAYFSAASDDNVSSCPQSSLTPERPSTS